MILSDKFICAGKAYSTTENRVPAPILKKNISVLKDVKKAEITVCGLGFYEAYLNGKNITKGRLCPYITNSEQVVYYDNYDITSLLKSENGNIIFELDYPQNAKGTFRYKDTVTPANKMNQKTIIIV